MLVSIHHVVKRKGPAESLQEAILVKDDGLYTTSNVPDIRCRPGKNRQVTLIAEEDLAAIAKELGLGSIPLGASRRQLMVRGIRFILGSTLKIGEATLLVEEPCDPCSQMEEFIGTGAKNAMEGRGGVCCRVLEGGKIKIGDSLQ